jgi:hypothetical protein
LLGAVCPALLVFGVFVLTFASGSASGAPIYPEAAGSVVVEAEGFSSRTAADLPDGAADADADEWLVVTTEFAGSGPFTNARGEFIQVTDANGINGEGNFSNPTGIGPFVDYVLRISTLGDYELFTRWDSPGTSNNSFYAMLLDPLGSPVGSPFTITGGANNIDQDFATNPWHDVDAIFTLASAGDYTLRLAPREDGVAIDAFVFQRTSLTAPTGIGPPATAPIPEPSTALLCALGLFSLASRRRRGI